MREQKPACENHSLLAGQNQKQLLLKDEGLEAIRSLCKSPEGTNQWFVAEALRKIGLLALLRAAWKWQEAGLCLEFVRNWNHQTKATRVGDLEINVSFENFALATALQAAGAGLLSRPMDHENLVKHFENAPAVKPQNGYMLDKCRDPILRDIVILLNMTLWMKLIRQSRCSGELLYLVVQAMNGLEVNWSRVFYEKFVCEVMRLQDVLSNKHIVSHQQLITVAGPLMCFLYDCAKINHNNSNRLKVGPARYERRRRRDIAELEQKVYSSGSQLADDDGADDEGGDGGEGGHSGIDDKDSSCTKRSYQDCALEKDSISGSLAPPAEMPMKVQKVHSTRTESYMELIDTSEQR